MLYYFFFSVNIQNHGVGISFCDTQRLPEMKHRSWNSIILMDPLQVRIFHDFMICRDPEKHSPTRWHLIVKSNDFWARESNLCLNWNLWINLNHLVNIINIYTGMCTVNNLTFSSSKLCPKFVSSIIIAAISVVKSHINFWKFAARWNGKKHSLEYSKVHLHAKYNFSVCYHRNFILKIKRITLCLSTRKEKMNHLFSNLQVFLFVLQKRSHICIISTKELNFSEWSSENDWENEF